MLIAIASLSLQATHRLITVHDLTAQQLPFPSDFIFGIATSSSQNEEDSKNSSWSSMTQSPGAACKSWSLWNDDIEKLAYLGVDSYRFSIEWSRIQPTANSFDQDAIDHYVTLCQKLQAYGIQPLVCLHHYSDPIWFLQAGGFAYEQNIKIFTNYCKKIYEALRPYVKNWIVISQPTGYALKAYHQAMQPPFIKDSNLAELVMLNLFKTHIKVYDMMHHTYATTKLGLKPSIGICHQIVQMEPYIPYSPLDHIVATFADRLFNKSFFRFFSNGHFRGLKPLFDIAYIPQASQKFDFFALSYYCPKSFLWAKPQRPKALLSHQTADLERVIDKEGMYNAIVQAASLGKPVYIVESGIDPVDDDQRILLLNSYLSAILQALRDGYDVKSYYYWTLMDNYEWSKARGTSHFGLYHNRVIDADGTLDPEYDNHKKMLKPSGKAYKEMIKKQHEKTI